MEIEQQNEINIDPYKYHLRLGYIDQIHSSISIVENKMGPLSSNSN